MSSHNLPSKYSDIHDPTHIDIAVLNDAENNRGNIFFSIRLSFLIEHNLAEFCFFALQNSVPNVHFRVNPAAYSCISKGNALLVLSTNTEALKSSNKAALTNLNCSLTHWNSIESSSELLISQQNLLPNLPFLEHLSGHRHRFPLFFQQYLEKINITLFVCFIFYYRKTANFSSVWSEEK